MAKQLGQSKGEFFDKDAATSMAVKVAKSETVIINQTKQWLKEQEVIDFDALEKNDRGECKRNKYVVLIKNLPYTATEAELKEIFERHGQLTRFMISPFNTLGIAEYASKSMAQAAMKNLAYYKVNYVNPIYLEYAPKGLIDSKSKSKRDKDDDKMSQEEAVKEEKIDEVKHKQSRQIFVKNLNFDTIEAQLE